MECPEIFSDIVSIRAYRTGDVNLNFHPMAPPAVLTPSDVVLGDNFTNVIFDPETASLSESEAAGNDTRWTVSKLVWNVGDEVAATPDVMVQLTYLKRYAFHYLVTRADGKRYLITGNERQQTEFPQKEGVYSVQVQCGSVAGALLYLEP